MGSPSSEIPGTGWISWSSQWRKCFITDETENIRLKQSCTGYCIRRVRRSILNKTNLCTRHRITFHLQCGHMISMNQPVIFAVGRNVPLGLFDP